MSARTYFPSVSSSPFSCGGENNSGTPSAGNQKSGSSISGETEQFYFDETNFFMFQKFYQNRKISVTATSTGASPAVPCVRVFKLCNNKMKGSAGIN